MPQTRSAAASTGCAAGGAAGWRGGLGLPWERFAGFRRRCRCRTGRIPAPWDPRTRAATGCRPAPHPLPLPCHALHHAPAPPRRCGCPGSHGAHWAPRPLAGCQTQTTPLLSNTPPYRLQPEDPTCKPIGSSCGSVNPADKWKCAGAGGPVCWAAGRPPRCPPLPPHGRYCRRGTHLTRATAAALRPPLRPPPRLARARAAARRCCKDKAEKGERDPACKRPDFDDDDDDDWRWKPSFRTRSCSFVPRRWRTE